MLIPSPPTEETLSTLRYADQAKKIKNKAVVNESETDKIIRELNQENLTLKQLIENLQKQLGKINDPSQQLNMENLLEMQAQFN